LFVAAVTRVCFAEQIEAVSVIKQVTVFGDSALVSRNAVVKTGSGEHTIVLSNILSPIDENSIRVSAKSSGEVTLLGAQLKQVFLTEVPQEQVRKLQEQIQDLRDGIKGQQDVRAVLRDEKAYLDSVRLFSQGQMPKDLVTKMPSPAELEATLKFLEAKLKENVSAAMESDLKTRDLENKLRAAEEELGQISGPVEKQKRSIIVSFEAAKPCSIDLTVSYLTQNATWRPVYDARASFETQEVELGCYAMVKQETGEPWQNVEMFLSTARPSVEGKLPAIDPWILRPYRPAMLRTQKAFRSKAAGMMNEVMYDKMESAKESEAQESKVEYAQALEGGTAVVYAVKRPVTVNSDGTEYKLPVFSQALKADFRYSSYPKALAQSYLGSKVKNSGQFQLLGGQLNVFLGNDYVGSSDLKPVSPQEEFDLYLGADDNVKVVRELVEKKVDETLIAGLPSPNRTESFKYRIKLENYKSRPVIVNLFESMPVPENDKIKVKINQASLEPKAKDWESKKGVWFWEIELAPAQKKEILYSFTIEYPRDMKVEGL